MRIAVFVKRTTFHKGYGGLETQNKILCEGLSGKGNEVVVFSPKWELSEGEKVESGVTYVFVPGVFRSLMGFASFSKKNWEVQSVVALRKYGNFDVAISQSSAGLGVIKNKNKLNLKVISISHGSITGELKTRFQSASGFKDFAKLVADIGYFFLNFFYRQRTFVLNSNKVVAVSEFVKKSLIEETFVAEDKVEVIYNGIEPVEVLNKRAAGDNVLKLIYVGVIHKSKGLWELVNAVSEMGDVSLQIAGAGEHLDELKAYVAKKGLEEKVKLLGKLPQDQVVQVMAESDIFVLPSKRIEGFPMTLVEAMFAGLPIIATNAGGVPEAIIEGETGFVVKLKGIKLAIEKLRDPVLRQNMSEKAKERAQNEFTAEIMVNKYLEVIRGVTR